jgi:hypothetical protein
VSKQQVEAHFVVDLDKFFAHMERFYLEEDIRSAMKSYGLDDIYDNWISGDM